MSDVVIPAQRINRGRGHSYLLDGERVPGVTTILRAYPKQDPLTSWVARSVSDHATDNWETLATLPPSERNAILRNVRFDLLRVAAERGTHIHDLARRYFQGEEIVTTEADDPFAEAIERFGREWEPFVEYVEAVIVHRTLRYMGTLDLLATIHGERWLLDWKTTASGIWPDNALQLTAYRYAEFIVGDGNQLEPMPRVDRTGCVWLRDDGSYDLVPTESGPYEFATFMRLIPIAQFVQQPREATVGEALRPPEVTS